MSLSFIKKKKQHKKDKVRSSESSIRWI